MKRTIVAASTVLGGAIVLALLLRPSHMIPRGPELAAPERIAPALRQVIASKMRRHAEQLPALISKVVVLDYDGAAKAAGEIFDEPGIARPVTGDELNSVLPERFFVLQDALRSSARQVVEAAARRDSVRLADAFGTLTRTCVSCHTSTCAARPERGQAPRWPRSAANAAARAPIRAVTRGTAPPQGWAGGRRTASTRASICT